MTVTSVATLPAGLLLSGLPRSGASATAVIIPIALVLQFVSSVHLGFSQFPKWLQTVASVFLLKWMDGAGHTPLFLPTDFA